MFHSTDLYKFITVVRQIFMLIGFVLFMALGSWSLGQMNNQTVVRGTDNPQVSLKTDALLPR